MSQPRVLLIEDDPSIRHFVAMVLDEMPIRLESCATLAEARARLAGEPIALLLTDLMLPDGSGLDLLGELQGRADAPARLAVFSAGVTGPVRQRLQSLGVGTVLPKPASVAELEACVRSALDAGVPAAAPETRLPGDDARRAAVAEFFGGDAALFAAYEGQCLRQFAHDIAAGDAAVDVGDLPALRRTVHSLKAVLRMLGHAELARLAETLEHRAAEGDPAAVGDWPALRGGLSALSSAGAA